MIAIKNLTGILLAGGKSSRIGSDKGLITFRGKKLARYSLDLLEKFCGELLISSDNREYSYFGYPLVMDEFKEVGPIGGIYSALQKSTGEWNLIVGCDMPFLNDALIDHLLKFHGTGVATVPVHQGRVEPLAALYHLTILPHLFSAITEEKYSLQSILRLLPVTFLPVDGLVREYPNLFNNFNYPGDFFAAE